MAGMSSPSTHVHHSIDYIEILARDVAEARAFYSNAFGWAFNDYGPDYAGIRGVDREMGGLCKSGDIRKGGPLVVLFSNDLDATVAAVRRAGGEITKAPFEFPGGRRFHFADPSGNELGVWSVK